jgi:hypothetical protein
MLFSQSLAWLAARLAATGTWMFLILGAGLGGYIAWKWVARRRFLRKLRIARVTPEDLKEKLDKPVLIVDCSAEPIVIPGAQRIAVEDLEQRHLEIPRDRDLILYCS